MEMSLMTARTLLLATALAVTAAAGTAQAQSAEAWRAPQAGDWLPLPASGRFQFRLRLYDTPIATQAGETRAESLPRIARIDCP
ncbi:MAG: hypothetical protein B7Z14_15890 [Bosea sp. 32-68-6]|nr:MAG: hypothetical protein B7Z14_15890 [Bosea sp. 32-68-6]